MPEIKYENFDDIKVSVKTIILTTNLILDIQKMYNILPVTEYIVVPRRRGRKKRSDNVNPNREIQNGSIITVKYKGSVKGVELKKKVREDKNCDKYFRNSITIIMIIDTDKIINFKVSRNGKFQLTGCKTNKHAEDCFAYFWNYVRQYRDIVYILNGQLLEVLYIPAMRNIDFNLNFLIDREKLSMYINVFTKYHAILESSIGYTGVNIKLPIEVNIFDMGLKKHIYDLTLNTWSTSIMPYSEYLNTLSEKENKKKIEKERHNTFLVFHSGKCIMSGISSFCMRDSYFLFMKVISECKEMIMEKLNVGDEIF